MSHWRTARLASGGQPPAGPPHTALDTHRGSHIARGQRDMNSIGFLPNSLVKEREFFIQPFEFGSYCLLFGVLLLPCLFVCAAVFFYAAFIA
jgi:hypothetical protein